MKAGSINLDGYGYELHTNRSWILVPITKGTVTDVIAQNRLRSIREFVSDFPLSPALGSPLNALFYAVLNHIQVYRQDTVGVFEEPPRDTISKLDLSAIDSEVFRAKDLVY